MICVILVLFNQSCTNDLNKIKKITFDPNAPDEVSTNFRVFMKESGYAQLQLFATYAETFNQPHMTKLKDSLKVDFYGVDGEIVSTLTANYGEINYDTQKMFVRDSVKFVNHEDQRTLYTTILYWNQEDSTIYTNENVKLVSPKGTAYGSSLKAKQDFTNYRITDPRGAYEFNQKD